METEIILNFIEHAERSEQNNETVFVIYCFISRKTIWKFWAVVLGKNKGVFGKAVCNPNDVYSAPIGRKIALIRAISDLNRSHRKAIWKLYWEKYPCG